MALAWTDLLDELRRADLLVGAPADGPTPAAIGMDSRTVAAGHGSTSPCAARRPTGTGSWPTRCAAARRRWWSRAPQQSGVPEIVVRDGRRAALALGPGLVRPPRAPADAGRRHRHQRQDHDDRPAPPPVQRRARAPAASARSARSTAGASRCDSTAGLADDAGPDRSAGHPGRAARPRAPRTSAMEASSHSLDQGRLDGLTFAAARVHQPHPRSSRLPRHHGGVPRRQAAS